MKNTTDWLHAGSARAPLPGRTAALLAAFAIAYYALAMFAAALPVQSRFPLSVWPADGLALGALLVASRSLWVPFAGLAFAATLTAGLQAGMAVEAAAVASTSARCRASPGSS